MSGCQSAELPCTPPPFHLAFRLQAVPNLGQNTSFLQRAPGFEHGARPRRICGAQCSREQATLPALKISAIIRNHIHIYFIAVDPMQSSDGIIQRAAAHRPFYI